MLDRSTMPEELAPRREPIFNIPPGIALTLLVLAAIHAARLLLPDRLDLDLLVRLAFVPGRLTYLFDPAPVVDALMHLAAGSAESLLHAEGGRYFLGDGSAEPWTLLTYALLHASWTHLGLNAVWLLAFGTPLARRVGSARLLAVLVATSVAGALFHLATHLTDLQPVIGASAAVSGCMGATLRFMFQPETPVSAIIGLRAKEREAIFRQPRLSLGAVLRDRRALTFLIAWFLTNLLFGVGSLSLGITEEAVAWQAHIGGFLCGLLLFPLFDRPAAPQTRAPEEALPEDPAAF